MHDFCGLLARAVIGTAEIIECKAEENAGRNECRRAKISLVFIYRLPIFSHERRSANHTTTQNTQTPTPRRQKRVKRKRASLPQTASKTWAWGTPSASSTASCPPRPPSPGTSARRRPATSRASAIPPKVLLHRFVLFLGLHLPLFYHFISIIKKFIAILL